jgi:acyl carrier protein
MKRLLALLANLFSCHRRDASELKKQPELDDQAFYEAYYAGGGIPEDIPIRIRKVYAEQLGACWKGVRPGDNVGDAIPDLDLAELLYDIEDEFGIKFPDDDVKKMDGTFDAIVRYIATHRPTS